MHYLAASRCYDVPSLYHLVITHNHLHQTGRDGLLQYMYINKRDLIVHWTALICYCRLIHNVLIRALQTSIFHVLHVHVTQLIAWIWFYVFCFSAFAALHKRSMLLVIYVIIFCILMFILQCFCYLRRVIWNWWSHLHLMWFLQTEQFFPCKWF